MNDNIKNKAIRYLLITLQAFIGFTAIAGGLRLVANPGGMPDIPIQWLSNSPFTSYFIPGLVLVIIIGFGNVLAVTVTFLQKKSSGNLAVLSGLILVLFMTIEIWFVGLRNFLQPMYFILGTIVLILGAHMAKRSKSINENETQVFALVQK